MLFWPLIILVAGWLLASLMAGQRTPYYISDIAPSIMLILTAVLAFLVGPVVFGSEYAEGARDFLHSRPVSETKVFWSKTTALVAFSLLSAFILCYCLYRDPDVTMRSFMIYIFSVWMVFLVITFWCSAATVLARDLVRGILYGIVSLVITATATYWLWFGNVIPWLSGMSHRYDYRYEHLWFVYGAIPLALIPCAILSILRMAHSWEARKQLLLHSSSLILMFLFLAWFFPTLFVIRNDGKAVYAGQNEVSEVFGKTRQGNRLYLLHALWRRSKTPAFQRLALSSVDLIERGGVPAPAAILETTFGTGLGMTEVHFTENHLQIAGTMTSPEDERSWIPFRRLFRFPDGKLISMEGEVGGQNVSPTPQVEPSPEVESETRLYRIESTHDKPVPYAIKIYDRSEPSSATSKGEIPLLACAVCDGNLLAGFETSFAAGKYPWKKVGGPVGGTFDDSRLSCQDLVLVDTTLAAQPKRVVIPIPGKLWKPYAFLVDAFGNRHQLILFPPPISLGGGYLCVWFRVEQVVGVWDISHPEEPHFVGSAHLFDSSEPFKDTGLPGRGPAIGGATTPVRRADGALGFVTRDGLLWLEFPALMKGARS
jgi:hypothetical protein